jgi:hypothetical protein
VKCCSELQRTSSKIVYDETTARREIIVSGVNVSEASEKI